MYAGLCALATNGHVLDRGPRRLKGSERGPPGQQIQHLHGITAAETRLQSSITGCEICFATFLQSPRAWQETQKKQTPQVAHLITEIWYL
jgi:hypothetical protein